MYKKRRFTKNRSHGRNKPKKYGIVNQHGSNSEAATTGTPEKPVPVHVPIPDDDQGKAAPAPPVTRAAPPGFD
jgi:hypothetical protein